jgi:hypothetical protein
LWTASTKKAPSKHERLIVSRSGVSKIKFTGDQGVSTPVAAVLTFKGSNGIYYGMEKVVDSEAMFFHGEKIRKPRTR